MSKRTSFRPANLIEIDAVVGHDDGEPVGFGDAVDMVHRDHRARARHVLHDEAGIARNVKRHKAGEQARPAIVEAARRQADDDTDGFTL